MMKSSRRAGNAALLALAVVPCALAAQRPTPRETPTGTQLVMLGTAAGPPLREDRSEPATLLIVDGREYLIDCGIGTARRLVKAGIRSETIGTIFLTHLHPDHTLGLADVLANDFQNGDRLGPDHTISIYGPPQTKALVDAAWRYISIPYAVFAAEAAGPNGGVPAIAPFSTHEIGEGVVYQDDRIRVVAAENTHYALMPAGARANMKSYSYRIETPHGTIVFTGDTGPSDAITRLAEGADVLVSETEDKVFIGAFIARMAQQNHWPAARRAEFSGHMMDEHLGLEEVGRMATAAHVRSVLLYHWYPDDPAAEVAGVAKYFSGPVFGSADLERYCVSGRSSTEASSEPPLRLCK